LLINVQVSELRNVASCVGVDKVETLNFGLLPNVVERRIEISNMLGINCPAFWQSCLFSGNYVQRHVGKVGRILAVLALGLLN
jgi:hypothetical protein